MANSGVRAAVEEHFAAFNAHDTGRLLAGLADDAVWRTGTDTVRGRAALAELFDDWLWARDPSLTVRSLVIDGDRAAAEFIERLTTADGPLAVAKSVFLTLHSGLITAGTVYNEGSADLT